MRMEKKLRVLIIRNAYQQDAGGAEQYALNLAISLRNNGYQPILVTKVRNILNKASDENIQTIKGFWYDKQGWSRAYYLRYPLTVLWYLYIIIMYRINIVHPQSRDDFIFATHAAKLLNKKIVWTDHADLKHVLDNINHFNPRIRKWVINASTYVNTIICVSKSEQNEIIKVAPDLPKPIVIHNGVFVPKDINPVSKGNKMVIGTNSRLVEDKGILELIIAFSRLKYDDLELWLLGSVSGNKKKYEKIIKKIGINKRVKIIDYVSRPNNYVASMDIFVHPSYHEGLSLAIIEAAMLAKPIIATKVGGTPEIINNHCGILIEPRDPDTIQTKLELLIANGVLATRLGNAAQKKALKEFNFDNIIREKIIPIYGE